MINSVDNNSNYKMSYNNLYTQNSERAQKNLELSRANKKKVKKRRLNYNHTQLSGAIRNAKKAANASVVLGKIQATIGSLRKELGAGKYDDAELKMAIEHAEEMAECATQKLSNLRMEENMRGVTDQKQQSEQMKANMAKQKRRREQERLEAEYAALSREKALEQNMEELSDGNRADEDKELNKADMRYLKKKMEYLADSLENGEGLAAGGDFVGMSADSAMELSAMPTAGLEQTAAPAAEAPVQVSGGSVDMLV